MSLLESTISAPVIKAAARDIKAFRDARGYRPIPISYSSVDSTVGRVDAAEYLACGGNQDETIDLFGMHVYSWCGNQSYYTSGYDKLYEQFQDYNLPIIFSETGCDLEDGDRDFSEVATMLGPVFQAIFSGTIVYEWAMEDSGYGIVEYSDDDNTGFPHTQAEYNSLGTVYSSADLTGTSMPSYTPSNSPPACPTSDSSYWLVDPNEALPTIAGLDVDTVTARTTRITSHEAEVTGTGADTDTDTDGVSGSTDRSSGGDGAHGRSSNVGAIVGIVIAGVVVVIAIVAAILFFRRRKAKKEMSEKASPGSEDDTAAGASHPGGDGSQQQAGVKAELPASSVGQVRPRQEMDASQQPHQGDHGGLQEYYGPNKVAGSVNGTSGSGQFHEMFHEMEGSSPPVSELPGRRD